MMGALTSSEAARLAAIMSRMQSTYEGEQVAAALAASRFITAKGLQWADVIGGGVPTGALNPKPASSPSTSWREVVARCLACPGSLRRWEIDFLRSLQRFPRLSPKQGACLRGIAERVLDGGTKA